MNTINQYPTISHELFIAIKDATKVLKELYDDNITQINEGKNTEETQSHHFFKNHTNLIETTLENGWNMQHCLNRRFLAKYYPVETLKFIIVRANPDTNEGCLTTTKQAHALSLFHSILKQLNIL
jgi:DNA polymerase III delta subunit